VFFSGWGGGVCGEVDGTDGASNGGLFFIFLVMSFVINQVQ